MLPAIVRSGRPVVPCPFLVGAGSLGRHSTTFWCWSGVLPCPILLVVPCPFLVGAGSLGMHDGTLLLLWCTKTESELHQAGQNFVVGMVW